MHIFMLKMQPSEGIVIYPTAGVKQTVRKNE